MHHYILTILKSDGTPCIVHIEVDPNDKKFIGPFNCTTNAASTNFWKKHLTGFDVKKVTNARQIEGSVSSAARTQTQD